MAIRLAHVKGDKLRLIGGKASRLWEMEQNSFPIPEAASIPSDVYHQHLAKSRAKELIQQLLGSDAIGGLKPENETATLEEIRSEIENGPLSEELVESIKQFVTSFPAGSSFAVRSSSVAEDTKESSYAGQYETYLHQLDVEQICTSVKRVWASQWKDGAVKYHKKVLTKSRLGATKRAVGAVMDKTLVNSDQGTIPEMGVVIQRQILCTAAGVMFTVNPLERDTGVMMIESCFGLGEGIAGGLVVPDTFTFHRFTKEKTATIRKKNLRVVPDSKGGIVNVQLSPDEQEQPSLTQAQVDQLFELGLRIHTHYNYPQDVEFGVDADGKVYLLQSRPITVLNTKADVKYEGFSDAITGRKNSFQFKDGVLALGKQTSFSSNRPIFVPPSKDFWTLDPAHFPKPISRIAFELVVQPFDDGFVYSAKKCGLPINGLKGELVNLFLYVTVAPCPPDEIPQRIATATEFWEKKMWHEHAREWDEEIKPRFIKTHKEYQKIDVSKFTDEELQKHLEKLYSYSKEMGKSHHLMSYSAVLPVADWAIRTKEWTGLDDSTLFGLMAGFSPVSRGVLAPEAAELVKKAFENDASARSILYDQSGDYTDAELWNKLKDCGGAVGDVIAYIIENYGHRITSGYDPVAVTLNEMPSMLLSSIRVALEPPSTEVEKKRQEEWGRVRALVPDEHKALFDDLANEAKFIYGYRDQRGLNTDSWSNGILHVALLEAGRRLQKLGRLPEPELIFEAETSEIEALWKAPDPKLVEFFKQCRAYRLNHTVTEAPATLGAAAPPPLPPPETLPPPFQRTLKAAGLLMASINGAAETQVTDASIIKGLGACHGQVEGIARVILEANSKEFARIHRGDIIVVPATSAAFNSVLPLVSAIVADFGGLLTHAAIVAREYGIPCVVSCFTATARIPDGCRISVDGKSGTVTILDSKTVHQKSRKALFH